MKGSKTVEVRLTIFFVSKKFHFYEKFFFVKSALFLESKVAPDTVKEQFLTNWQIFIA